MPRLALVFLCGLSLVLAACQHSPRKNYYLLTAPGQAAPASSNITSVVGVGPISIADYLSRSQIAYTEAGNRLVVSQNDYWGEPLDKGIMRVLIANLAQRNSARSFSEFPWRSDARPSHSVRVQIQQLDCTDGHANLEANWELVDNNTRAPVQRRHFVRSIPASTEPAAIARAYSQLIADLATDVDQVLTNFLPPPQ